VATVLVVLTLAGAAHAAPITERVADINPGGAASAPHNLVALGNFLYFQADDGIRGPELWRSNGITTELVSNIRPGASGSSPSGFTELNGYLYFQADDGTSGAELWRTNGIQTQLVSDINSGGSGSPGSFSGFAELDGWLYFAADDGTIGRELWRTNGTTTALVADINPDESPPDPPFDPPEASTPQFLTAFNGFVYFQATGDNVTPQADGNELWRTSGSGAQRVMDINDGHSSSFPHGFTELDGFLYFDANGGSGSDGLWRTNGTTTQLVRELDVIDDLTRLGPFLYFSADDGANGSELWRTDGATTALVENIRPGSSGSNPAGFSQLAGRLYFEADDGTSGVELWRTDGTTTSQVMDINTGPDGSHPGGIADELVVLAGYLYFAATDGTTSVELWRTNGAVTELVRDINPGFGSSPQGFARLGSHLYFSADDGATSGRELWRVAEPAPGIEGPPGSDSCSDGVDNDDDGLIDAKDPGCQEEDGAPAAADLSDSPSSIAVNRQRRFKFKLGATPDLTGKIVFESRKRVQVSRKKRVILIRKAFNVPADGKVELKLRLSKKKFRILKLNRRISTRATVTLTNTAGLTSKAGKRVKLKAPPKR